MSSLCDRRRSHPHSDPLLEAGLDQFREECFLYSRAVGSYNTHLANHRERRDLYDIPFRAPVSAHDRFDAACRRERAATETLLADLIDEAHLDSELRRHPRTYPSTTRPSTTSGTPAPNWSRRWKGHSSISASGPTDPLMVW